MGGKGYRFGCFAKLSIVKLQGNEYFLPEDISVSKYPAWSQVLYLLLLSYAVTIPSLSSLLFCEEGTGTENNFCTWWAVLFLMMRGFSSPINIKVGFIFFPWVFHSGKWNKTSSTQEGTHRPCQVLVSLCRELLRLDTCARHSCQLPP